MKRPYLGDDKVDVLSSDGSASDVDTDAAYNGRLSGRFSSNSGTFERMPKELSSEDALKKRAEMYQQYMKQIPIPMRRGSVIPFTSWMGLGKSVKQLYGQPLHYLTNLLLKQWDQERIGSEDEHQPLDSVIHPCKAEATIWLIEEIHRRTSSSCHVAKLWLSDPMHDAFIDSALPNLGS